MSRIRYAGAEKKPNLRKISSLSLQRCYFSELIGKVFWRLGFISWMDR